MRQLGFFIILLSCGAQAVSLITLVIIAPGIFNTINDRSLAGETFGGSLATITSIGMVLTLLTVTAFGLIILAKPQQQFKPPSKLMVAVSFLIPLLLVGGQLSSWLLQKQMSAIADERHDNAEINERFQNYHSLSERIVGAHIIVLILAVGGASYAIMRKPATLSTRRLMAGEKV